MFSGSATARTLSKMKWIVAPSLYAGITIERMRFAMTKKWVSYLYRTAQPLTLATFRSWGISAGAGRIRLTRRKIRKMNGFSSFH